MISYTTSRTHSAMASTRSRCLTLGAVVVATTLLSYAPSSYAARACERIAEFAARSCAFEVSEEYWEGQALCQNESTQGARRACQAQVRNAREESRDECREVRAARLGVCRKLARSETGNGPYAPNFGEFANPLDIGVSTSANPYMPLHQGNQWVYEDSEGEESVTVEVTSNVKSIEDATCVVVRDTGAEDFTDDDFNPPLFDVPVEITDDWIAQTANGDIVYCGEISQNFEPQAEDVPNSPPELVDVEGSWKWGRDGAQPGILMFAAPEKGTVYRQEFLLGDAEDIGEVRRVDYVYGNGDRIDQLVPVELAAFMQLCGAGCIVTKDYTPLEPGVREFKFYAPGIGLILEVDPDPEEGGYLKLVSCNVPGSACDTL